MLGCAEDARARFERDVRRVIRMMNCFLSAAARSSAISGVAASARETENIGP